MTREEALQILDTIPTIGEQVDALEMAIEALSTEPCEDCISREEAKRIVDHYIQFYDGQFRINESIDNLPSVQPIRPKGEWIPKPYSIEWKSDAKCSNCGNLVAGALSNYVTCPYCSADMR